MIEQLREKNHIIDDMIKKLLNNFEAKNKNNDNIDSMVMSLIKDFE